jgi:hypothetical protein
MKPQANDDVIKNLNFLCKTYDAIVTMTTGTKNRLQAINPEMQMKNSELIKNMDSFKGKASRQIEKELEFWPIWTAWMKDIPGIGPFIAGNLILLYYYRFVSVCKECGGVLVKQEKEDDKPAGFVCAGCGKKAKGDGVLAHKIDYSKDFPNVSKWWAYMGEHVVDGKKPKMKKGQVVAWSPKGRLISYQVGESFNKFGPDHPYKAFLLESKAKLEAKYPEKTKGHRHSMARMMMCKLFLSHFWHIAREFEGKSTRGVYADVILDHTGIIPPFFYNPDVQLNS